MMILVKIFLTNRPAGKYICKRGANNQKKTGKTRTMDSLPFPVWFSGARHRVQIGRCLLKLHRFLAENVNKTMTASVLIRKDQRKAI